METGGEFNKGMMVILGIVVPLYIVYATKIHSKNDFQAELSNIVKCIYS